MKKLVIITTLTLISAFASADIAIIVSKTSTATKLTKDQVQDIFLAKKNSFPDGTSALPLDNKESAVREKFNETILEKTSSQVKSYWSKLIFTGKGTPPKDVDGSDEVKKLVANNPNTIGYIDKTKVDASVKVVFE